LKGPTLIMIRRTPFRPTYNIHAWLSRLKGSNIDKKNPFRLNYLNAVNKFPTIGTGFISPLAALTMPRIASTKTQILQRNDITPSSDISPRFRKNIGMSTAVSIPKII